MLDLRLTDISWTLFLDRDGVLNYEKPFDYIYSYEEFTFYDGVLDALKFLAQKFSRIILTSNQRGVGKGLMTEQDLIDIHERMLRDIEAAGGRIDKIYYSIGATDDDPMRKPNPGMAWLAKKDFPQIDFKKSIMVGNNISDMDFGRNVGMSTVFIRSTHPDQPLPYPSIDLAFNSLAEFAKGLQS
ncbi:MAG TPA: HAD-IIIA family hydrolase [Puia sp.]|nr:HAD-IIIA family hydrolase [Puia sp.]